MGCLNAKKEQVVIGNVSVHNKTKNDKQNVVAKPPNNESDLIHKSDNKTNYFAVTKGGPNDPIEYKSGSEFIPPPPKPPLQNNSSNDQIIHNNSNNNNFSSGDIYTGNSPVYSYQSGVHTHEPFQSMSIPVKESNPGISFNNNTSISYKSPKYLPAQPQINNVMAPFQIINEEKVQKDKANDTLSNKSSNYAANLQYQLEVEHLKSSDNTPNNANNMANGNDCDDEKMTIASLSMAERQQRQMEQMIYNEQRLKNDIRRQSQFDANQREFKQWLDDAHCMEYYNNFNNEGYDEMHVILDLTDKDLIDIGINKKGHRIKILKAIEKYKIENNKQNNNNNDIIKSKLPKLNEMPNENEIEISLELNSSGGIKPKSIYSDDDEKESRFNNDKITDAGVGVFNAVGDM